MNKAIAVLAFAGAIGVSGCASLNPSSGLDINQVIAATDAALAASCAVLNGALPTAQSIQALITADIPGLVSANNAVITGENLAAQICAAVAKNAATSSALKAGVHAPVVVDGVTVYSQ